MTVKEAPVRGLRAVFARFRGKGGKGGAPSKVTPAATASASTVAQGGNVKVVEPQTAIPETIIPETATPETPATAETVATATAAEPQATASESAAVAEATAEQQPAEPAAGPPEAAEPQQVAAATAEADLPVPQYDSLTVASLRARLRNLTPAQLTVLIDYERTHQGRDEVVGMFERRITKIKAGETTSFQAVK